MTMRFRCPCGKILQVEDAGASRKVRCPHCSRVLRVPEPGPAPALRSAAPAADGEAAAKGATPEAGSTRPKQAPPRGRILLVDAVEADREAAREILNVHGYTVIEAADGEQAVNMARESCPDLILADVRLPVMSGFQMVQALKDPMNPRNAACWQTPIILTTRKVRGRDKQYAISIGVGAYVEKPLTPANVCSKIERLLSGRRLRVM